MAQKTRAYLRPVPKEQNQQGRLPGDPSQQLISLISFLQRQRMGLDEIVVVPDDLFDEAREMVRTQKGASIIINPADPNSIMFCGCWIGPPPVANV